MMAKVDTIEVLRLDDLKLKDIDKEIKISCCLIFNANTLNPAIALYRYTRYTGIVN